MGGTESCAGPIAHTGVERNADDGNVVGRDIADARQPGECGEARVTRHDRSVDRLYRLGLLRHVRHRVVPPLIWMVWPTNAPMSSRANNETAAAMSSGFPMWPTGISRAYRSCISASVMPAASASTCSCGVSMIPGATPLTVMCSGASSRPSDFVNAIRPALDAA